MHAEEHFVIVDKPAGMLSVPGRGEDKQDCARARVEQRFPRATGSITCHRLDMDTSGLIVMALDPVTHRKLSGQFEKRRVRKWYEAVVTGHVPRPIDEPFQVDLPQCVDWPNRPLQKIDFEHGKPGKSDVIPRAHETWTTPAGDAIETTRVEFRPITGRTHQLRVHAAAPIEVESPSGPIPGGLASPIIGDRLYGDPSLAPRLLLHARRLGFWHPYSGEWVAFESPAPF
ncbi:MAG: pseudouridine synthase [Planctomycetota bacterium]